MHQGNKAYDNLHQAAQRPPEPGIALKNNINKMDRFLPISNCVCLCVCVFTLNIFINNIG